MENDSIEFDEPGTKTYLSGQITQALSTAPDNWMQIRIPLRKPVSFLEIMAESVPAVSRLPIAHCRRHPITGSWLLEGIQDW